MLKPSFLISLATLMLTLPLSAAQTDLERQRDIYQKIKQLLSLSQSEQTLNLSKSLLAQIKDYPLYPYAEYRIIDADKKNLSFAIIEDYQRRNPDLFLSDNLKRSWLQRSAENKDWQGILAHQSGLPSDQASQCLLFQARQNLRSNETTSALLSAHLPQKSMESLWLTGKSLPKQCDPILAQWAMQGGLSDELLQQRAMLAFEAQNHGLLTALQKYAPPNSPTAKLLNALNLYRKSPQLLLEINQKDAALSTEQKQRIAIKLFPLLLKNLQESAITEMNAPFAPYQNLAQQLNFSPAQTEEWKKAFIGHIFDSEREPLIRWRDQELLKLKDDKLSERRIRTALRQKQDTAPWLALLSEAAKNKDEWLYWQAKNLPAEKSRPILTALAQQRGFYAMLANAELQTSYRPSMSASPSAAQAEKSLRPKYSRQLDRIAELRYFSQTAEANQEWSNLLNRATDTEKLALARYAQERQWFDLNVEATIRAKAWNHIALRLPMAYTDWFDLLLQGKRITPTFAMAIARQESAWKPYVSSSANARGLMQLLPTTAKLTAQKSGLPYNHENQLYDPFNNIMLGTAHLQELYEKYGNNRILIAAAYNAGAGRVEQWLNRSKGRLNMAEFVASIPFYETRGYVQNVLSYDAYYQILRQGSQQLFSDQEYNRLY
ncbi:soluble lytic murein transglycosylase [Mesocricetibacter intestinalis]|uniref:Soluble lytic murein transglycosylase n=1 Tax=Mesocricetibacter intestinalis TaxID=1521930 RepID=A0A4R6VBV7_9PAST|nr:transglycosylase SLT domain-containing protein [Mesocricetibacter intestinalis]TDQ59768.1 soluble lytic murein transglycosylase [Mesocricetibacter intestinalis]